MMQIGYAAAHAAGEKRSTNGAARHAVPGRAETDAAAHLLR